MSQSDAAGVGTALPQANQVVRWYRAYCTLLLALFLGVAPLLVVAATALEENPGAEISRLGDLAKEPWLRDAERSFQRQHQERVVQMGMLTFFIGLVLAIPVAIALVIPPTPGAWVYHILILCLGLSGCTLPFSVLLLIQWFQPTTQAYFGRG